MFKTRTHWAWATEFILAQPPKGAAAIPGQVAALTTALGIVPGSGASTSSEASEDYPKYSSEASGLMSNESSEATGLMSTLREAFSGMPSVLNALPNIPKLVKTVAAAAAATQLQSSKDKISYE